MDGRFTGAIFEDRIPGVISSQMKASGGSEITANKKFPRLFPVQPEPETIEERAARIEARPAIASAPLIKTRLCREATKGSENDFEREADPAAKEYDQHPQEER